MKPNRRIINPVIRSGSWSDEVVHCRSAYRYLKISPKSTGYISLRVIKHAKKETDTLLVESPSSR